MRLSRANKGVPSGAMNSMNSMVGNKPCPVPAGVDAKAFTERIEVQPPVFLGNFDLGSVLIFAGQRTHQRHIVVLGHDGGGLDSPFTVMDDVEFHGATLIKVICSSAPVPWSATAGEIVTANWVIWFRLLVDPGLQAHNVVGHPRFLTGIERHPLKTKVLGTNSPRKALVSVVRVFGTGSGLK